MNIRPAGVKIPPETAKDPIVGLVENIYMTYMPNLVNVLIEKQLRYRAMPGPQCWIFINGIIETALHTAFSMKGAGPTSIAPKVVKSYHAFQETYAKKKKAAVQKAKQVVLG